VARSVRTRSAMRAERGGSLGGLGEGLAEQRLLEGDGHQFAAGFRSVVGDQPVNDLQFGTGGAATPQHASDLTHRGRGSSPAEPAAAYPTGEQAAVGSRLQPAVADQITGEKWNRYIFRTGRNSSQDAISNAVAIGKPGVTIATLGQDYAFGRDGVAAFKEALAKTGATLAAEEYVPTTTTDFTAAGQRLFDALKDKPGRKIIWVIWAGGGAIGPRDGKVALYLSEHAALVPASPKRDGPTYDRLRDTLAASGALFLPQLLAAGLGVLAFLALHIVDIFVAAFGPGLFNDLLFLYKGPAARVGEIFLAFGLLYHALNGLRIIAADFIPTLASLKVARTLFWVQMLLFLALFIPASYFMMVTLPGDPFHRAVRRGLRLRPSGRAGPTRSRSCRTRRASPCAT